MPEVYWQRGGIVRWGAYVPKYRLPTELISKEWGGSGTTHKSVANIDEGATTLGIEAARRAVVGFNRFCVFRKRVQTLRSKSDRNYGCGVHWSVAVRHQHRSRVRLQERIH